LSSARMILEHPMVAATHIEKKKQINAEGAGEVEGREGSEGEGCGRQGDKTKGGREKGRRRAEEQKVQPGVCSKKKQNGRVSERS